MINIYLDMDDVLVDFKTYVKNHFNITQEITTWYFFKWMFPDTYEEESNKFFKNMSVPDWVNLGKTSRSDELYQLCRKISSNRVCILSAPPTSGLFNCATGKNKWIQKHYPDTPVIIDPVKWRYAAVNSILIDDKEENCNKFIRHGGHAWLYTTESNKNQETQLNRFNFNTFEGELRAANLI